jgi:D-3-phosphoglycerate dehydrogenase / 2-oxoglutarate reductase
MARIFLSHAPHAFAHYYGARALAGLAALGDVVRNPTDHPLSTPDLLAASEGCQVIVSDRNTPGEGALFERHRTLEAFVRCAMDIRTVDVPAATAHGILVTRASAGFDASVAELVVGAMIDLSRDLSANVAAYRAGRPVTIRMGRELRGSTLGILGYGFIGRYLGRLGAALGMEVLVHDPHLAPHLSPRFAQDPATGAGAPRACGFEELLRDSDYVVCLVVATPDTENLIDARAFAAMKPTAFFVNASRGNLVDEAALVQALDDGRIAGAAIDVGRAPDQMPSPDLARRADVIASPHVGGLTPPAIEHQSMETVRQTEAILAGRFPTGSVNPDQATRILSRGGSPR